MPRVTSKQTKVPAYQVKLTLRDVKPPVWRRLVLPGHWHLDQVHEAIQVAMGWTNSHLHEFQVGEQRYGVPAPEWDDEVLPETQTRLHEVLSGPGDRLTYWYDFGTVSCLAGRGNCPPEDCGGPWGYAELLAALADPAHEEHESFVEWLGGDFDPKEFDRAATDAMLARLG
jgi:Plasmid pRiA4b ORF-3-like protein